MSRETSSSNSSNAPHSPPIPPIEPTPPMASTLDSTMATRTVRGLGQMVIGERARFREAIGLLGLAYGVIDDGIDKDSTRHERDLVKRLASFLDIHDQCAAEDEEDDEQLGETVAGLSQWIAQQEASHG